MQLPSIQSEGQKGHLQQMVVIGMLNVMMLTLNKMVIQQTQKIFTRLSTKHVSTGIMTPTVKLHPLVA